MRLWGFIVVIAVALLSTNGGATAAPKKQGFTEGGACHVVDGLNKGKTGTYDKDGDCCKEPPAPGAWGCTECGGSNTGKCKDGPAAKINAPAKANQAAPAGTLKSTK